MKNHSQSVACGKFLPGLLAALALAWSACVAPGIFLREQAARDHSEEARSAFTIADYDTAIELYTKSLSYHHESGNRLETCLDLLNLAVVYRAMGRGRAAEECMSGFRTTARELDGMLLPKDERRRLIALQAEADWFQAVLALDRGRREQARQFLEKARASRLPQLRDRVRLLDQRLSSGGDRSSYSR